WTSIATGKRMEKHGIIDWMLLSGEKKEKVLATGNVRRTEALWNMTTAAGKGAQIINWWATWPAEAIRGEMVSNHYFKPKGNTLEDATYPPELTQELEPFREIARDDVEGIMRGAGIPYDVRRAEPYGAYDLFDFDIPTRDEGDCFGRFAVRVLEMEQSLRIVDQALTRLPEGPIVPEKVPRVVKPPAGEYYHAVESARGHFGMFIVSDGMGFHVERMLALHLSPRMILSFTRGLYFFRGRGILLIFYHLCPNCQMHFPGGSL
ncbi:MAG: hypothetical protein ACK2T2_08970, partial [Anaerolineales bacterium]